MLNALKNKLLAKVVPGEEPLQAQAMDAGAQDSQQSGSSEINFDLNKVNFEQLRKKRAYVCGAGKLITPVMPADPTNAASLEDFRPVGDVLPIVPTQELETAAQFQGFLTSGPGSQLVEEEERKGPRAGGFNYDACDAVAREAYVRNFKLVKRRKISFKDENGYDMPVLIICNPNSGKHVDLTSLISHRLNEGGVPFEFMSTQQYLDTFRFARDVDLTRYSVLAVCGGDGSYHEIVNGMLSRADGLKRPCAFLPNGSGNDLCRALGCEELETALSYIVKGECIEIDTVRVLMDHDSEATLPEGNDRLNYCRHMMINSAVAMPAKIANTAIPLKGCCGTKSYEIATLWEACKGNFRPDNYDLFIDDERVTIGESQNIETTLLMVTNGKFTGAGCVINPFSVMNDGLIDVTWISDPAVNNLMGVAGLLGDAKKHGGSQAYKGQNTYMRGRKIRVTFGGRTGATEEFNSRPQLLGIDGEDLRYRHQVTWECCPNSIETMFDTDVYFREFSSFINPQQGEVDRIVDQVFTDYDANKNEKLSAGELQQFMRETLGADFKQGEFEAARTKLDKNGEGVSKADLSAYLMK